MFTLFIRFDNYDNLLASQAEAWFTATIDPKLAMYGKDADGKPVKTAKFFSYHHGVYQTIAAGDANGVYETQPEIVTFLKNQKDAVGNTAIPADGSDNGTTITVENHVTVLDADTASMNEKVKLLLTTAQTTYQPSTNATDGDAGTLSNAFYKKAVTTEILQNAFAVGNTRNYLMHGVWRSVADHENSHLDPRFQQAAGPTGAYVIEGPVEPFYQTIVLHNKA